MHLHPFRDGNGVLGRLLFALPIDVSGYFNSVKLV
ncbi:Fic family protein [Amniculibacterium sp. G2-70]